MKTGAVINCFLLLGLKVFVLTDIGRMESFGSQQNVALFDKVTVAPTTLRGAGSMGHTGWIPHWIIYCHDCTIFLGEGKSGSDTGRRTKSTTADLHRNNVPGPEAEVCSLRLNLLVKPVHYDLFVWPNLTAGTFIGNVSILSVHQEAVSHIRLHSAGLKVHKTTLEDVTRVSTSYSVPIHVHERKAQELLIVKQYNGRPIPDGTYRLNISFSGNMLGDLTGFYRSSYTDKGTTKYVGCTDFEPADARRAFPCFDEPGFKSTFSLTLVKPSDLVAVSNMPVEEERPNWPIPGLSSVTFQTSLPMTTYLLGWALGDFSCLQRRTQRGVPVRICTTPSHLKGASYASSITTDILDYFESYFGLPYPLHKLDIVGIPNFKAGAMENWGMITFREANLLYQPDLGSPAQKQQIASVIAHELAHMWFGNLVTMKWWNDLWLNEGFASFMAYKGVTAVHPSWDMHGQFMREEVTPILWLDGLQSSHAIVHDVSHPDQVSEFFDDISYSKAAAVIRMLEWWLGERVFRHGIRNYLTKFAFSNAITSDLWEQLQGLGKTNINVTFVMNTWTRQKGYPLVRVCRLASGSWVLTQERYLENRHNILSSDANPLGYKWEIPVGLEWGEAPDGERSPVTLQWIHTSTCQASIGTRKDLSWLKVNVGTYGFYRVHYGDALYPLIKAELSKGSKTTYSPDERCLILDDLLSLARSDYIGYNISLDFLTYLKSESHYIPWSCVNGHLSNIRRFLSTSNDEDGVLKTYKSFVVSLLDGVYHNLSWRDDDESESHLNSLLKPVIFGLACEFGYKPCLETTKVKFDQWLRNVRINSRGHANATRSRSWKANGPNFEFIVSPGVRAVVHAWGMAQSKEPQWRRVLWIYMKESNPVEKMRLLGALSSIQDVSTLRKLLEIAKNETIIRRQDFFKLLKLVSQNDVGRSVVWDFYRTDFQFMIDQFSLNDRYFGEIIVDITNDFSTQSSLLEVESFFEVQKEAGAGKRARQIALENIRNNIDWVTRRLPSITVWLRNYNKMSYT